MVADGVLPEWQASMAKACDGMRAAQTEDAALMAIRNAEEVVHDRFLRENPLREIENRGLGRLEALFSSKTWNALKLAVPCEDECLSETDKALSRLFRLASTCCRVRRY